MAAPDSVTIRSLNGKFVMNKQLSDPFDPLLSLQGIGWLTRKAIGLATVTLLIKQYEKDGVVHVDIDQLATGGVKGTTELRQLDNAEGVHDDHVFGKCKGRSRWVKVADVEDARLRQNWRPETLEAETIESNVENESAKWVAKQIWGFQDKNGKRYYARNVVILKGKERKEATLFYDYVGPL